MAWKTKASPQSTAKTGVNAKKWLLRLGQARAVDDGSGLVFPSPTRRGKPLSDMSLTALLRRAGLAERCTVHGMRSSFRCWASEMTDADHAVCELSLAHAVGGAVERAYSRSDLLAKRRSLMSEWGAYCATDKEGTDDD